MSTIVLKRPSIVIGNPAAFLYGFNPYALGAVVATFLFLSYFVLPHEGVPGSLFRFGVLFVVLMPIVAFVLSAMAVRQFVFGHSTERGRIASYITLGITALYFAVGMTIPVVLVGMYVVYAYII